MSKQHKVLVNAAEPLARPAQLRSERRRRFVKGVARAQASRKQKSQEGARKENANVGGQVPGTLHAIN